MAANKTSFTKKTELASSAEVAKFIRKYYLDAGHVPAQFAEVINAIEDSQIEVPAEIKTEQKVISDHLSPRARSFVATRAAMVPQYAKRWRRIVEAPSGTDYDLPTLLKNDDWASTSPETFPATSFGPRSFEILKADPTLKDLKWIIRNHIQEMGTINILGKPKSLKTFFAHYMMYSIAAGVPFMKDYWVNRGQVLYITNENEEATVRSNFDALAKGLKDPEWLQYGYKNFHLYHDLGGSHRLDTGDTVTYSQDAKGRTQEAMNYTFPELWFTVDWYNRNGGDPVRLVVFDPLVNYHTKNEDSSMDMTVVYRNIRAFTRVSKAAVMLVHHTQKAAQLRANDAQANALSGRGTGAIFSAATMSFTLAREKGSTPERVVIGVSSIGRNGAPLAHQQYAATFVDNDDSWAEEITWETVTKGSDGDGKDGDGKDGGGGSDGGNTPPAPLTPAERAAERARKAEEKANKAAEAAKKAKARAEAIALKAAASTGTTATNSDSDSVPIP
jgi:hypothetical protein